MIGYEYCKLDSIILPALKEKKTTWIFIHGFLGAKVLHGPAARTKEMNEFSEIHLIDIRNHGDSGQSPSLELEDCAQDVAHYIEEKKLSKVGILGFSYGGLIGIELCTNPKFNSYILALVLEDIGPFPYHDLAKYPAMLRVFLQIYDLTKIKMRGTTRREIEIEVEKSTKVEVIQKIYYLNLVEVEYEKEFAWKYNLNALANRFFPRFAREYQGQF